MITIQKHGKCVVKYYLKCPYCECEFVFDKEDIYPLWYTDDADYTDFIYCPECTKTIRFNKYHCIKPEEFNK